MTEKIKIAITFLIIFLVAIFIAGAGMAGLAIFKPLFDVTTTSDDSDLILAGNNSAQTLGNTPSNTPTVQAWNTTHYNTNGSNQEQIATSLAANLIFPSNLSNMSWGLWFRRSGAISSNNVLIGTNGNVNYLSLKANADLWFQFSSSAVILNYSTDLNDSQWHNVFGTKQGFNVSLYIDGVLVNSTNFTSFPSPNNAGNLNILDSNDIQSSLDIDEIRVYNRSLNQTDISEIYNSGRRANYSLTNTGLLAWYPLNENSSFNITALVYDFSVYNGTGTRQNIAGAIANWITDNIKVTLINATDYTISGNTFTITNLNYAWSELNVSYVFTIATNAFSPASNNLSEAAGTFFGNSTALFQLIALFIIISLLGLAIFAIYKFVRVGDTDYGLNGESITSFFSGSGGSGGSSRPVNMGKSGVGFRTGSSGDGSFSGV